MDAVSNTKLAKTVVFVVEQLANGRFDELAEITNSTRLTASEMEEALSEYGINLLAPISISMDELDVVEVSRGYRKAPHEWSVWYQLVDKVLGPSDLTLRLTIVDKGTQILGVEVDDIRVN
ncbi:hypothetical protein RXV86_14340 [Alisedimentitalea sp. MJ-SS2]|uniref:DUF7668 domain-containing protein n=1 Tax=Aliisedimentitalea sp. MJ-SS2 TaxID=3049795 RepID=UPI00290DEE39|nr:hypothetical protein [Alisedimentitalea sp. MJ-SS2]MDU8928567.1 hypothetical protein [Alisedimentitalea sp. MJ-SS2]